jgi:hypothetical protein
VRQCKIPSETRRLLPHSVNSGYHDPFLWCCGPASKASTYICQPFDGERAASKAALATQGRAVADKAQRGIASYADKTPQGDGLCNDRLVHFIHFIRFIHIIRFVHLPGVSQLTPSVSPRPAFVELWAVGTVRHPHTSHRAYLFHRQRCLDTY